MYEMLTGEFPFQLNGKKDNQGNYIEYKRSNESPPPIEELRSQVFQKKYPGGSWKKDYQPWLELMILDCLKIKPEERFRNVKDLHDHFLTYSKIAIPLSNPITQDLNTKKVDPFEKEKRVLIETNKMLLAKISDHEKRKLNNSNKTNPRSLILILALIVILSILAYFILRPKNTSSITNNQSDTSVASGPKVDTSPFKMVTNKEYDINGQKYKYTGNTLNGLPEGEATAIIKNGDTYKGYFKNGYMEGKGKYSFVSGAVLEGNFRINEAYGPVKFTFSDGKYYIGEFYHSDFNGKGVLYKKDGTIDKQGIFRDGVLIGR